MRTLKALVIIDVILLLAFALWGPALVMIGVILAPAFALLGPALVSIAPAFA